MWRRSRTAAAFRRNLLQLFDSPASPRRPRGGIAAGASSSSSVCPFARALNYYSSKASPFSEIRDFLNGASVPDPVFIKRKVQEDVVCAESQDSDDDDYSEPDIKLRSLFRVPLDEDPAATMARLSLEVCSNLTLTWKTRTETADIICEIAHFKPKSLEKYKLVNPILQAMLPLLVVGGDAGLHHLLSSSAESVVEEMALNHPEQVFPPVLEFASSSSQNANPNYRVAAVTALGCIAEGCSELMKDKLEPLLGIVLGAHRDPEPRLRAAASSTLHRFAKHLRPEIVSRRQTVLPCILSGLDENNNGIRWNSYPSLQALCDSMTGEEILPFLDPIMNRVLTDLQSGSFDPQMRSFSAMCSVAAAADQHFVPYAERVLETLTRTVDTFLTTSSFVFAGALVTTVGRARMEPALFPYIEAAVLSWDWGCHGWGWGCHKRKYAYVFFCTVAETLGDGFAKYLPDVVPRAIYSCNLDEDDCSAADDLLDEKAAAARALGLFAVNTKSAFAPYLEESMSVMINLSSHYHEDVRLQGVTGLRNILTAAAAVSESPSSGAAKEKQLLGTVMDHYIKTMDEDGDKRVVAQVCTNTAGILEDFGYAALEPYVPQIIDSVLRLLQGQSACQRADDTEHEETLVAAVSNLLSALAKAAVATSRFAPSMYSMLSDAYIKLSEAPGSSRYRTTAAA